MPTAPSAEAPDVSQDGLSTLPHGLLLVSTPIGNLGDMTVRARAALMQADVILCEDTRHTSRLLAAYDIRAKLETLHEHNEDARIAGVLDRLKSGQTIALVSDAGMPVVSDPGYRLVRAAIAADLPVTALPGANAAMTALVLSGLPPHPCLFLGFPPPRQAARRGQFGTLRAAEQAGLAATLILYEAPHRLCETLMDLLHIFGDRPAAVARELTKRFETVRRGPISELIRHFSQEAPRGEITVVVGPPGDEAVDDVDADLRRLLQTHSVKDAALLVSTASGLPRKAVYARALQLAAERDGP